MKLTATELARMEGACKEWQKWRLSQTGMKHADALRHFREQVTAERVLELIAIAKRASRLERAL